MWLFLLRARHLEHCVSDDRGGCRVYALYNTMLLFFGCERQPVGLASIYVTTINVHVMNSKVNRVCAGFYATMAILASVSIYPGLFTRFINLLCIRLVLSLPRQTVGSSKHTNPFTPPTPHALVTCQTLHRQKVPCSAPIMAPTCRRMPWAIFIHRIYWS